MITFPNAKLNLGLNILGKRQDGYHDIRTAFYPVPLCDVLEILPAGNNGLQFTSSGSNVPGKPEENLCLRAFALIEEKYGVPAVHMHLHKVIPSGAGLGGGSADAVFTLVMLNKIFDLNLTQQQLEYLASSLGSDCAFFLTNKPVIAGGRGNIFEQIALPLSGLHVVIVQPDFSISTAEAYTQVKSNGKHLPIKEILQKPVEKWKRHLVNDFEDVLFHQFPSLKEIKEKLYSCGAAYASMSGSGSALFGLFRSLPKNIERDFPGNFVWAGKM